MDNRFSTNPVSTTSGMSKLSSDDFLDSRKVRFSEATAETTEVKNALDTDGFSTDEAFTPKISKRIGYKDPRERPKSCLAPPSSLSRPNIEDILKRVSIVIHSHIHKCHTRLQRATPESYETGKFHNSKMDAFNEELFLSPQYVYHFVRQPILRLGFLYGIRKITKEPVLPTITDVHLFLNDLFNKAQLSAECSIVCLIYVERLMEHGNVPLVATTWRPILLCGMLLASKVWQDLSSWNSEIAEIYPQYSLQSINRLERMFCGEIKWDLYISSSTYAKYYFALRSLTEKRDFRANYNVMRIDAPGAEVVAERSGEVKDTFLMSMSV